MNKNLFIFTFLVLVALSTSSSPLYASSIQDDEEPIPLIIKDPAEPGGLRNPAVIPISCSFDAGTSSLQVSSVVELGPVDVDVENITSGGHSHYLWSGSVGSQSFPILWTSGTCSVTFSLSSGEVYYGEFTL